MDFMAFLTATQNLAFLIAGILVAAIFVVEFLGTMIGFSLSHLGPDFHIDLDHDGTPDHLEGAGLMAWLNPGGVPFMIFLTLGTTIFAIVGYAIQAVSWSNTAYLLPGLVIWPISFLLTLICVRPWTRWINRVLPREESSDVSLSSLVGESGVVTVGPVTKEQFGFIRVRDKFGTDHSIQVAANNDEVFAIGAEVQLVGPHPTNLYAYLIR